MCVRDIIFFMIRDNLYKFQIMIFALNIHKTASLPLTHLIATIQLVIQFCNAFMKLCCDTNHTYTPSIYFWNLAMVVITISYNISIIIQLVLK